MQNRKPQKKTTTALWLAAVLGLSGLSVACSSGFHAIGVLQTQSNVVDADKSAPSDSLQQIQVGADTSVQTQDPILRDQANKNTSYKLPANNAETIRVRLLPIVSRYPSDPFENSESVDSVQLANENGLIIKDLAAGTTPFLVSGNTIKAIFSKKQITIDGKVYALGSQSQIAIFPRVAGSLTHVSLKLNDARITTAKIVLAKAGELPFRGLFLLRTLSHGDKTPLFWNLINYVSFNDYIHAVVPSEIPSTFPNEALKAQAIAARTFALREMILARCIGTSAEKCQLRSWDVDPSTAYQSFVGALAENMAIVPVIDETKNQVLSFKGAPILSMFHASSGGTTVSATQYYCRAGKLHKDLSACTSANDALYPYLQSKVDPFNGNYARFGHGVGLPQRSAEAMAKAGHTVTEILAQYYPGAKIVATETN